MKKGHDPAAQYEIESGRSLSSYIGRKTDEELSEFEKGIKAQFNLKVRSIQHFTCDVCLANPEGYVMDPGGLSMLLNKQFGLSWTSIPWGKFDEILEWVKKNHHKEFLLLQKDYHYEMLSGDSTPYNTYREWFYAHEKRAV